MFVALNYKTYPESAGKKGVTLSKAAAEQCTGNVIVCPQAPDLALTCKTFPSLSVFAQHCDENNAGAFTGAVTAQALKEAGCSGSLLNHSEKKVPHEQVGKAVEQLRFVGLKALVCADSVEEAVTLAKFRPWAIAVEPPELIGRGVSVSKAKPEVVGDAVKKIKAVSFSTLIFVGAGVSNAEDVKKCRELGAEGVLLASAFVKAADPASLLKQMLEA